jgi:hypothetical protein
MMRRCVWNCNCFATLTASATFGGLNHRKVENDVKDLLADASTGLGNKAQKGLEGKVGDSWVSARMNRRLTSVASDFL